ncbi:FMN-dependent NADH-azoreductase [Alteromonas sp. 38]|uniref:FMN-dependent NADH-azoreductase n=1 Tax=Alteromonas TaxID=226 RepID=UPI0012F397B9|nr:MULTISPECIES: NAD(P)H-dependent oxidoreductase [Alteromonas]CAD5276491.1 FMN-dependent NADH-azoreductase [Alteromonas sp. 154]VXB69444.1 FMN-dependent NADH-azoreductase [Alteromonas sp. 38]
MTSILVVYSSLNGENSQSTELADFYLQSLEGSEISVTKVDVAKLALAHLTSEEMQAWMTDTSERSASQKSLAAVSDDLVAQLQAADEIVLAVPMYNFGIPSSLKAYFDRVARAGITFKYTETGPVGLLEGKQAKVFASRGGLYEGSDYDTQTGYLTHFLNFIGITDVKFVYAEGLSMGEDGAHESIANAKGKIIELTPKSAD